MPMHLPFDYFFVHPHFAGTTDWKWALVPEIIERLTRLCPVRQKSPVRLNKRRT